MIRRNYTVIIFIYTMFLLYMMFFGLGREASDFRFLQVNPFQTIRYFCGSNIKEHDFIINIIGNIFVFCPYGCLGISLKKLNKIAPLTFVFVTFICLVEFAQYFTGRGTADVDDVLLNILGMLLGFGIMQIIMQINLFNFALYFNEQERKKIPAY